MALSHITALDFIGLSDSELNALFYETTFTNHSLCKRMFRLMIYHTDWSPESFVDSYGYLSLDKPIDELPQRRLFEALYWEMPVYRKRELLLLWVIHEGVDFHEKIQD